MDVFEAIADVLGVPAGKEVRIMLPLGVPKEPGRQRERLPFAARAGFNRYEGGDMKTPRLPQPPGPPAAAC